MTCVVVNDASCLIDLKKGELLHVLLRLPYRFIVPLPIREEELLDDHLRSVRQLCVDRTGVQTVLVGLLVQSIQVSLLVSHVHHLIIRYELLSVLRYASTSWNPSYSSSVPTESRRLLDP